MDETMPPVKPQVTVFLPCHALDDLPDWLDEHEADAVLSAWTVAWHPAALFGAAGLPDWASLDLPWTRDGRVVGLVPPGMSERFQAGVSPSPNPDQEFLHEHDADHLQQALLIACDAAFDDAPALTDWQREQVDDFRGLGLATLLRPRPGVVLMKPLLAKGLLRHLAASRPSVTTTMLSTTGALTLSC
jgi:hypothetical protein